MPSQAAGYSLGLLLQRPRFESSRRVIAGWVGGADRTGERLKSTQERTRSRGREQASRSALFDNVMRGSA
jgi:hypothetical protein